MNSSLRLQAHHASDIFVLSKAEYFAEVHVWPERQHLDPHNWLLNFTTDERPFAVNMLNVFMYFNELLVDALLRSSLQGLSAELTTTATSLAEAKAAWREFLAHAAVTYVEGETPNPTDSGRTIFARKARQVLGFAEHQIMEPAQAVRHFADRFSGTLILLDDFVGGGSQMNACWHRHQQLPNGRKVSYAQLSAQGVRIVYAPLVATSHGLDVLDAACPGLMLRPVHRLDQTYSLLHEDSVLWPQSLKADASHVLEAASARAGILHNWKGFHDLGLGVAFWHSVPDATLPLFYWDTNGWFPLIRRA